MDSEMMYKIFKISKILLASASGMAIGAFFVLSITQILDYFKEEKDIKAIFHIFLVVVVALIWIKMIGFLVMYGEHFNSSYPAMLVNL